MKFLVVSTWNIGLRAAQTIAVALGAFAVLLASVMVASATICGTETHTLYEGQTTPVGTVTIWQDIDQIHVKVESDVAIKELHVWVGTDLDNMPSSGGGAPIPGQFPYKISFPSDPGTHTYTFNIDWEGAGIVDVETLCGAQIFVVVHAALYDGETAFAGNVSVNVGKPGRWWYYIDTTICVGCDGTDPQLGQCETAFGKGVLLRDGYVFAKRNKANPEHYPTLSLSKSRWGWAINLGSPNSLSINMASGTYIYDIWAGAGLNKTWKGTKVGTLSIEWDSATKTASNIKYELVDGYLMPELHVYASDVPPTKIAPGKYGFTKYFDPASSYYTTPLSVTDTDGDGVWIIAHAVVCEEL